MAFAGALMGALIAGIVVANGEGRAARHVAERKARAIDEWLEAHPETFTPTDETRPPQGKSHDGSGTT
jgi:hypothetical protein